MRAERGRLDVDLDDRRRRHRSARRAAVVHMFSAQPQPTIRSAPLISSAASGEAKPPRDVQRPRVAVEQAVRDGRGRQQRAGPLGDRAQLGRGRRARPGRRRTPAAAPRRARRPARRPPRRTAARRQHRRAPGGTGGAVDRLACTSSGRLSTTVRRSRHRGRVGPDGVGDRGRRRRAPARAPRRPPRPARPGRCGSSSAARPSRCRRRAPSAGCGSWRPRRCRSARW